MHALTPDELKTLQGLADSDAKQGMAVDVGATGSVDVDVLTLNRLADRGMVKKVTSDAAVGGRNLAHTYELTDKGQEALDQTGA